MQIKKTLQRLLRSKMTPGFFKGVFFSKKYLKQKGWYKSWYLGRPVEVDGSPMPWFTYPAVHFIEQKLSLKPMRVFEFGSGNSTVWFSARVKNVISVESDADFYSSMKKQLGTLSNVSYKLRDQKNSYSTEILQHTKEFDIVIIDGIDRIECAKKCIGALADDGVIIFDNADRIAYKEAYDYLTENGFKKIAFTGVGPLVYSDWQTTIYYRDQNCFKI